MKQACLFVLAILGFTPGVFGQEDAPVIKAEVMSAFVWGEDSRSGAISSTIQDPLTGYAVHKLSYGRIEVSSRMGFERFGANQIGTLLNYAATIVNTTDSTVSVRYGGISVEGHAAAPLWVVLPGKKLNKRERNSELDVVELLRMHCFTSGFLSSANIFSADTSSQVFVVAPGTALTVSSVIRDPRSYHAMRCSVEGCFPTGTIRYYLTVNSQDYVFVWPGRSAVYCGK